MNITFRFIWHQGELSEEREVIADQTGDETPYTIAEVGLLALRVFTAMEDSVGSKVETDPKDESNQ